MPRPQFSIRTLLWLTLVVAAFLGGMLWEREAIKRQGYIKMQMTPNGQDLELVRFGFE